MKCVHWAPVGESYTLEGLVRCSVYTGHLLRSLTPWEVWGFTVSTLDTCGGAIHLGILSKLHMSAQNTCGGAGALHIERFGELQSLHGTLMEEPYTLGGLVSCSACTKHPCTLRGMVRCNVCTEHSLSVENPYTLGREQEIHIKLPNIGKLTDRGRLHATA